MNILHKYFGNKTETLFKSLDCYSKKWKNWTGLVSSV